MLINLISWIFISCIAYIYGRSLSEVLQKVIQPKKTTEISIYLNILIGLCLLTIISAYFSIFMSISWLFLCICLVVGYILFIQNYQIFKIDYTQVIWQPIKNNILLTILSLLISIIILFQSSVGPFHYDTGLYHGQAVEWIEKYPTILGLGNLHFRFAYNSLIFPLFSLFKLSFIFPGGLHSLNGLILLIAILFSLSSIPELLKTKITFSNTLQLLLLLPLVDFAYDETILASHLSSFSSDLPCAVLFLVMLVILVKYIERRYKDKKLAIYIVLISALLPTIKLSYLPTIIITLFILFKLNSGKNKTLLIGLFISGLPWLVYIIKNIMLSGYIIYPFPAIDWFNVDWKIPLNIALSDKQNIALWGKIAGPYDKSIVEAGFYSWFPLWLKFTITQFSSQFLVFSIVGFSSGFFILIQSQKIKLFLLKISWVYCMLIFAILFWFSNSPLLRYGYGIIWGFSILLLLPIMFLVISQIKYRLKVYKFSLYVYIILCLLLVINQTNFYWSDLDFLIGPMDYPSIKTNSKIIDQQKIYKPEKGDQCWNSAFPCTPYLHPQLELRGESLQMGFKIRTK